MHSGITYSGMDNERKRKEKICPADDGQIDYLGPMVVYTSIGGASPNFDDHVPRFERRRSSCVRCMNCAGRVNGDNRQTLLRIIRKFHAPRIPRAKAHHYEREPLFALINRLGG